MVGKIRKNELQCIVTALKAESDPLIRFFDLTPEPNMQFPLFRGDGLALVRVGVGKNKIAGTLGTFLKSEIKQKWVQVINIGIAGGNPKSSRIGKCYLVNKVVDAETNETYNMDISIKHNLDERSIVTVTKGISNGKDTYPQLIDMEASSICAVTQAYIPINRLAFLKVVSDYMDLEVANFSSDTIAGLIKDNLPIINKFLMDFRFKITSGNDA